MEVHLRMTVFLQIYEIKPGFGKSSFNVERSVRIRPQLSPKG